MSLRFSPWIAAIAIGLIAAPVFADEIPIIDAHSQIDQFAELDRVVPILDRAGVSRVILAARGRRRWRDIAGLAARHPGRVTASVRTKSGRFVRNHPKFYRMLGGQLSNSEFGAMAEVLVWHARKGDKAPEIVIELGAPQVQAALAAALERGWPFIPHIEFAAANEAGDYDRFMKSLKAMLDAHPRHPFALTHLGQLSADEVRGLIAAHGNIHFITSHANPIVAGKSRQPWIDMFGGGEALAPAWRALVVRYPDRFILGFDNVFAAHWGSFFTDQVALWRKALGKLPHQVAHRIAHRNAERLWRLPPAKYVRPKE